MKTALVLLAGILGIARPDPEILDRLDGPFGEYRPPEGCALLVTTADIAAGSVVDLSDVVLERGGERLTPVAVGRAGRWLYPLLVGTRPETLGSFSLRRDGRGRVLLETAGGRIAFAFAAPRKAPSGWSLRVEAR